MFSQPDSYVSFKVILILEAKPCLKPQKWLLWLSLKTFVWPAKKRNRLRLGGGPSPDTPAHSSSSSQSPLSNPSSPSSPHPYTPLPRDWALQRFSDTVTSCSNCGTNRKWLKVIRLKGIPPHRVHESLCGSECINGFTGMKIKKGVSWSRRTLR